MRPFSAPLVGRSAWCLVLLAWACSGESRELAGESSPAVVRAADAPPSAGGAPPPEPEEAGELVAWQRFDGPPEYEQVVPWERAHEFMGREVAAEGRVVATHNSGKACFLNFDLDWRGKFHGVIFASSFLDYAQPPEEHFLNRRIRLIGKVEEHRGAAQIVVETPAQIQVLPD